MRLITLSGRLRRTDLEPPLFYTGATLSQLLRSIIATGARLTFDGDDRMMLFAFFGEGVGVTSGEESVFHTRFVWEGYQMCARDQSAKKRTGVKHLQSEDTEDFAGEEIVDDFAGEETVDDFAGEEGPIHRSSSSSSPP